MTVLETAFGAQAWLRSRPAATLDLVAVARRMELWGPGARRRAHLNDASRVSERKLRGCVCVPEDTLLLRGADAPRTEGARGDVPSSLRQRLPTNGPRQGIGRDAAGRRPIGSSRGSGPFSLAALSSASSSSSWHWARGRGLGARLPRGVSRSDRAPPDSVDNGSESRRSVAEDGTRSGAPRHVSFWCRGCVAPDSETRAYAGKILRSRLLASLFSAQNVYILHKGSLMVRRL